MNGDLMVLALWQYVLLLLVAFLAGGVGGALALHCWQEITLNREIDQLLQDLPEQ